MKDASTCQRLEHWFPNRLTGISRKPGGCSESSKRPLELDYRLSDSLARIGFLSESAILSISTEDLRRSSECFTVTYLYIKFFFKKKTALPSGYNWAPSYKSSATVTSTGSNGASLGSYAKSLDDWTALFMSQKVVSVLGRWLFSTDLEYCTSN
jgi:hypothetical protein